MSQLTMDFEVIFIDDGSTDGSLGAIEELASRDLHVKYIQFAKNFGKELATTAGLHAATGNAALMVDADLQHPLELIPEFIEKWKQGGKVVIGIRTGNDGEGWIKKTGSAIFYRVAGLLFENEIIPHATDFRLLDRSVINEFNRFSERNRLTRGLIDWLGFERAFVYFKARPRKFGTASYNPIKLFRLALNSFVSHSFFPLKLAGYLGILIIVLSGPLGIFMGADKYIFHDPYNLNFSSLSILAVMILFLIGVVLSCLGLIALYIANIHIEASNRPLYVINKKKL
jgi:glycosyltransferase involved in cell wall biosynthesis